jgi:hypothetical protein
MGDAVSAHTPGPWYVSKRNPRRIIESGPRGNTIASCGENLGVCGSEQAEANARLIAVAPEMREALRLALDALKPNASLLQRANASKHIETVLANVTL